MPDTLTSDLMEEVRPLLYRPLAQSNRVASTVVARTSGDAASLVSAMERELRVLDPSLPVITAKTMDRYLADSLTALKVTISFLGGLGGVGLALACIGLYAVVAYAVSQRAREVGIRTALGARTGQVTWVISRDVAKIMVVAVALGSGLSFLAIQALRRVDLSSPAPGVNVHTPTVDASTLPLVALLMLVVGLVAAYLPARRAAKSDPLVVLRHD